MHRRGMQQGPIVLVADDIEETRDGIDTLLSVVGYRVHGARDEAEAVEKARRDPPDLILVSLGGPSWKTVDVARRIRDLAGLGEHVPIVIFCVPTLQQGAEVAMDGNVYLTRPDNFNQLRALVGRLLRWSAARH